MIDFYFKNIFKRYFDQSLEIKVQLFNLLVIIGIIAGSAAAIIGALLKDSYPIVIINAAIALLSFILLRVAEQKNCYYICSWIIVIAVFFIMFPSLYFSCGGYRSGAAIVFLIAFTFTAVLLEGYERLAALVCEYILYLACTMIVFYRPETAHILSTDFDYLFFAMLNFTTASTIILIVFLIRSRLFQNRQWQIEELNRELAARNETLAQYDLMKSDFLATVTHEINTPLAVIAASSNDTIDLLKELPLNMDELIENQEIIERRVKIIDNILLDLMDTAAIESGRLSLSRQPVDLASLLKTICDVQFKLLDTNNNRITYDLQPDLPGIWADPQRIEQVLINLLSNACRHTTDGLVTVKLARAEANQVVSVIDDGEGMDQEMARVALKQYVSTKADYWRHGIGLSICRRIIVAHGGEIWINSVMGRGTTISFSLGEESARERSETLDFNR